MEVYVLVEGLDMALVKKEIPEMKDCINVDVLAFEKIRAIEVRMELEKALHLGENIKLVVNGLNEDFQSFINEFMDQWDVSLELILCEKKIINEIWGNGEKIPKGNNESKSNLSTLVFNKIDKLRFVQI